MSGTAAPDPRRTRIEGMFPLSKYSPTLAKTYATKLLTVADAADRAAGVIRVRTDDAVQRVKDALVKCHMEGHAYSGVPPYPTDWFVFARAVLEALVTPPPVD